MTPTEILVEARSLIMIHGWIQGHYSSPEGYCAIGAILTAGYDQEAKGEAIDKVQRAVNKRSHNTWDSVVVFNDLPGTTVEDVIAVFDSAIEENE